MLRMYCLLQGVKGHGPRGLPKAGPRGAAPRCPAADGSVACQRSRWQVRRKCCPSDNRGTSSGCRWHPLTSLRLECGHGGRWPRKRFPGPRSSCFGQLLWPRCGPPTGRWLAVCRGVGPSSDRRRCPVNAATGSHEGLRRWSWFSRRFHGARCPGCRRLEVPATQAAKDTEALRPGRRRSSRPPSVSTIKADCFEPTGS